jgi:tRNA(Ile)-lysidine synthase
VAAVHFNHGLQAESDDWEAQCRRFCQQRKIEIQVHQLALQASPGSSPETMAREARYAVITKLLGPHDIYLTAHQADDQAETVLLNLMRGSGMAGLSGIQPLRRFNRGWLARPLLGTRREALEDWLASQQVSWIRDTSNFDDSMDRNFLRNQVIPLLGQRWPGAITQLQQAAVHLQQRSSAFEELLSQVAGFCSTNGITLNLGDFRGASRNLQAEIIRHWALQRGAPPPPRVRLEEFLAQLQHAHSGSHAELVWRSWLIKHQAGLLWMHPLPAPGPCPESSWGTSDTLELGEPFGKLHWPGTPEDIRMKAEIRRRSGVSDDPKTSQTTKKKIKEIMRITDTPHWLRDAIPLLWIDGELAAIGDWWFSPEFRQHLLRTHSQYTWNVFDPLLRHVQSICRDRAVDAGDTLV